MYENSSKIACFNCVIWLLCAPGGRLEPFRRVVLSGGFSSLGFKLLVEEFPCERAVDICCLFLYRKKRIGRGH